MATMNISLPDKMREWIDQQVATGRFSNASDLVRDLIRDAQVKAAGAGLRPPQNPPKA
jgi:antitoxin ParD1/3/4